MLTSSQRIVVNTAAQYTRTIINVCLSLYSTRLILAALGQTDFGIFTVVAGVVSMLSFATNALVTTTQRYLSYYHGKGNIDYTKQVFANSLLLHILIGLVLLLIFACLDNFVVNRFLNIDADRISAAHIVYFATAFMLFLSFLTAPFRALFIARENIIYISIIDIFDGIAKLVIALLLTYCIDADKLIAYSLLLIGVYLFDLGAYTIYSKIHYAECVMPRARYLSKQIIGKLSGFAGWTMYSTGCIIARTQGIAVLLNNFFGAVLNSAYGLALQVNGATAFIVQSISNAVSPQIIQAASKDDHQRAMSLSMTASKFAFLMFGVAAIPLIVEMDGVLQFWLGEVPDYTAIFCQIVLLSCLADQLTTGLTIINQATGKIRNYSLIINTVKLLTLPAAWLCLHYGADCVSPLWCYLFFEVLCAILRLFYIHYTHNLNIYHYVKNVMIRPIIVVAVVLAISIGLHLLIHINYAWLLIIFLTIVIYLSLCFLIAINKEEKLYIKENILKRNK